MQLKYLLGWAILIILFSATAHAQTTIGFTYDGSGNRYTRSVISLKSASIPKDTLQNQFLKPLDEQVGLYQTLIYPNPTRGMLRIDFPGLQEQEAMITVHEMSGRRIFQQRTSSLENQIDLSPYPNGLYILTIFIGQDKKEWKIIKE